MSKIKVYYEYYCQNNDGYYAEDNPEADYPNEIYFPPSWTTFLQVKEMDFKDIKTAFEQEDGDEHYTNSIVYITDSKDKIIFNVRKYKDRKDRERAEEYLIEKAKFMEGDGK